MSYLIQRLRGRQVVTWARNQKLAGALYQSGTETDPLCAEAADEIERLTAELASAKVRAHHSDCHAQAEEGKAEEMRERAERAEAERDALLKKLEGL